jgi:dienelactone hydrolase
MDKVLSNVTNFHQRLFAGLKVLTDFPKTVRGTAIPPRVNKTSIVANGYCFGGVMVLELARSVRLSALPTLLNN